MRYRPSTDLALKGLTFNIKGGEKVGIVGRTGAGKSTLSLAITRIVEIESGTIKIDGVNANEINLRQVREAITIIPQDPTLYKGNLRYNLDPTGGISDNKMVALLKEAGLDAIILKKKSEDEEKKKEKEREKAKAAGKDVKVSEEKEEKPKEQSLDDTALLNFEIGENGDNLSSGEKALICICRAILRPAKIVILDEATANIDIETEQVIQKLIKKSFKDCTMITIAHRLQTIMESDKVMVMSYGKVAEFNTPKDLLKNP